MKTLFLLLLCLTESAILLGQGYCKRLQFCSHASSAMTTNQVDVFLHAPMPTRIDILQNINNSLKIVNRILCLSNAGAVEIDVRAADCPNAVAVNCSNKKYILFSTDYLEQVMSTADSSVIYGIFAHEVGHLIRGDAWLGGDRKHEAELNADKFAGHILGLLNFKRDIALATLASVNIDSTETHPPKQKREEKIAEGWRNGQINRSQIDERGIDYIMECKPDINTPLKIVYTKNRYLRSNFYDVTCSIEGDSILLKNIKNVTYYLHPYTFINNSKKFNKNKELKIKIWGSFELRASVICENDGVMNEYLLSKQIEIYDQSGRKITKGASKPVYVENVVEGDIKTKTID